MINSYKSLGKYDNFIHLYTKQLVLGLTAFSILKISDWSDYMSDIFKDMQTNVGCEYISDLPSYKRKVWQEMKRLNPADYEERQLEDFSKYMFGIRNILQEYF